MANEHYENANTRTEEHQEHQGSIKINDMLEALNVSMDRARNTLTRALVEIKNENPDMDFGSILRRLHQSLLETIKTKPMESFHIVFGLLGLATFDSLTEEDKEALRNDTFDNN